MGKIVCYRASGHHRAVLPRRRWTISQGLAVTRAADCLYQGEVCHVYGRGEAAVDSSLFRGKKSESPPPGRGVGWRHPMRTVVLVVLDLRPRSCHCYMGYMGGTHFCLGGVSGQ
jgi:hypothetical protein